MGLAQSLPLNRRWGIFFAVWIFLLSGLVSDFIKSPGILQALRLKAVLETKEKQVSEAKRNLKMLQTTAHQLEKNRYAQAREIRRVLGFAAPDEIIFDFNHTKEEGKNGTRNSQMVQ